MVETGAIGVNTCTRGGTVEVGGILGPLGTNGFAFGLNWNFLSVWGSDGTGEVAVVLFASWVAAFGVGVSA